MTTAKPLLKKRIAKEILIFFGGLVVVGLTWSFLLLRNNYYKSKKSNLETEIQSLAKQLDSLPKDYIKELYDKTSKYFVVHYQVGENTYAIPKKQEQEFLIDPLGIKKKATLLPISSKGYSYIHTDIFKKYGGYELNPTKESNPFAGMSLDEPNLPKGFIPDSTAVFDFVDLNKFKEFLSSVDYRDKFYEIFKMEKIIVNGYNEDGLPVGAVADLGSHSDFDANTQYALKNYADIAATKEDILKTVEQKKSSYKSTVSNIWSYKKTNSVFLTSVLFLSLLLYPLRLSLILIKWAIKTVK